MKAYKRVIPLSQHMGDDEVRDNDFEKSRGSIKNYTQIETGVETSKGSSTRQRKDTRGLLKFLSDTGNLSKVDQTSNDISTTPKLKFCSAKEYKLNIQFSYLPKSEIDHSKLFSKLVKYGFELTPYLHSFIDRLEMTVPPTCTFMFPQKQKQGLSHL